MSETGLGDRVAGARPPLRPSSWDQLSTRWSWRHPQLSLLAIPDLRQTVDSLPASQERQQDGGGRDHPGWASGRAAHPGFGPALLLTQRPEHANEVSRKPPAKELAPAPRGAASHLPAAQTKLVGLTQPARRWGHSALLQALCSQLTPSEPPSQLCCAERARKLDMASTFHRSAVSG